MKSSRTIKPIGRDEEVALQCILKNKKGFKSYLQRLMWQCSHGIMFDVLCVIDGVDDPADSDWTDVILVDKPVGFADDQNFLHEEL
ncbi:MAG: hypothetical protein AAF616_12120 [Bacteroidota bacterium]